jgi:hypothetical protein
MWQIQAQIALDLARERARDAERQALADRARASLRAEAQRHGLSRPGPARVLAAESLRRVSSALGSVSDAACEAATRLDHRTA